MFQKWFPYVPKNRKIFILMAPLKTIFSQCCIISCVGFSNCNFLPKVENEWARINSKLSVAFPQIDVCIQ